MAKRYKQLGSPTLKSLSLSNTTGGLLPRPGLMGKPSGKFLSQNSLGRWCPSLTPNESGFVDAYGSGVEGVLSGSVVQNADHLDFSNSGKVTLTGSETLVAPKMSASIWVNYKAGRNSNEGLFAKDFTSHVDPYYDFHLRTNTVGLIGYATVGGFSTADGVTTSVFASEGVWHNAVLTFDETDINLYLDGLSIGTKTNAGSISFSATDWVLGNARNFTAGLNGLLDDFQIFDKALSVSEVTQLFSLGRGY